MMRAAPASLTILFMMIGGCSFWGDSPSLDYRTVPEAPARDQKTAKDKNAEAITQFHKGHIDKAERLVQEALVADVTYGPAHNTLGTVLFRQRNYYLAAWEFEYAAKAMPGQPEPLNNLGHVYEAVGRLDEAIAQYENAHVVAPEAAEYLGNLLRARMRRGDQDAELVPMFDQLVFIETRPEWTAWAEQQRVMLASRPPSPQPDDRAPIPEEIPRPPESPTLPPQPATTLPGPMSRILE
jgi:Flp pilus assembly protein TadD